MNNNYRRIEPAPVLDKTADAISIPHVSVQLFCSCSAQYEVRQLVSGIPMPGGEVSPLILGPVLLSGTMVLSDEDYAAWGDDDNYIYEKIAERHGLTLIPLDQAVQ